MLCVLGACNGGGDEMPKCHRPALMSRYSSASFNAAFVPLTELPLMVAGTTSSVRLYCDTTPSSCDHICSFLPFDLPYEVEVRDGPISLDAGGSTSAPTFYAAGAGSGTLAFVNPDDGSVYAEIAVRAAEVDHVTMRRVITEREPPDLDVVLSTGHRGPHFEVWLSSADGNVLDDTSLEMQLPPGAQRWSTNGIDLYGVPSGTYTLGFQAGTKSFTEPLEIVNEPDTIELWEAPATIPRYPIIPGSLEYVCFMGKSRGRYITGLHWQHTVDGSPADAIYTEGCVLAATYKRSGSLATFTASAGGLSLTVQIPAR